MRVFKLETTANEYGRILWSYMVVK